MLISAIITTRNRADLLRKSIESVLNQEPCEAAVELIVVDDDSTDDTPEVVASYPGVRYIKTQQGTCGGSRNVGIEQAAGEWLAFLDDDDVWLPHKLRSCFAVIQAEPEARLIASSATICDWKLNPGGLWEAPDIAGHATAYDAFLEHVVTSSVVLLHREVFQRIGLFSTSDFRVEDREMWYRVTTGGFKCVSIKEPLALYRLRPVPRGDLLHNDYINNMRVIQRYFRPGQPMRPSWQRRQQVRWRTRGWYTGQLLSAAREAQLLGQNANATLCRRLAFRISPLHWVKMSLHKPAL